MAFSMTSFVVLRSAFMTAVFLLVQPLSAADGSSSVFLAPNRGKTVLEVAAKGGPSGFLAPQRASSTAREAAKAERGEHLRHTLVDHLALLLMGISGDISRFSEGVSEMEQLLYPILVASPKNDYGNLDDKSARYALHRLFMERHGWHFNIFDTPVEGVPVNTSSSSIFAFQGHLPKHVRDLLERQFQRHHGYGRLELALFAVAVEHLIFAEVPARLANAYSAKGVEHNAVVGQGQARDLVDVHMAAYISNFDLSNAKAVDVFKLVTNMAYVYEDWEGTRDFFRGVEAALATENGEYTFRDISKIVSQIEKEFVHWNNHQCSSLKNNLLKIETQSSGRVRLLDFYNSALYNGSSEFVETTEYLRQLGNLDESDPLEPRVIISNYRDGPNSCVAMTSFYSVCCVDECADLYSHLERSLKKPEATPAEILPLIQSLASPSIDTCVSVADTLVRRLEHIAERNHGVVMLHGAEFAEWMHFVYPSECTQASLFGPARYLTVDEWQAKTHLSVQATTDELREYSSHLSDLERAKRMNSAGQKLEWDVAASASWPEAQDESTNEHADRLRGTRPSVSKLHMPSIMAGFVAFASVPALFVKLYANQNDLQSCKKSKSHAF